MITKRIIPCLDVRDGMVVKGVRFDDVAQVATPMELAKRYNAAGADELVFYDIAASVRGRRLFTDALREVASHVFIPLTVGGGISTLEDFDTALNAGADKVSVNTGAVRDLTLIPRAARIFGSQCVTLSVDVKRVGDAYRVFLGGGKVDTGLDALEWIRRGVGSGAGELVVNSIDTDGVRSGFDLPLLTAVCAVTQVPVIASGGAGREEDFLRLFRDVPRVDAALAASVFHFGEVELPRLKAGLSAAGIPMRL